MKCVSCFVMINPKYASLKHCEYCNRDYCRKCLNPINHGCLKVKEYLYKRPKTSIKRTALKEINNRSNLYTRS